MQRSFSERPGAGVENIVGGTLDSLFRVGDVRPPSEGSGRRFSKRASNDRFNERTDKCRIDILVIITTFLFLKINIYENK